ncbi:MAG: AAA family ATPase, partial [Candidatus Saccharimonadales bacterium]
MAKKQSVRYVCNNCGETSMSWAGKCPHCGEWNTLQEELVIDSSIGGAVSAGRVLSPTSVGASVQHDQKRLITNMRDVDEVLGGGIVIGSVNLIAGQPGIGKSTLLMQLADAIAQNHKVLYVSGEESSHQVGMRAERLGVKTASSLQLATSTSADDIASTVASKEYELVIVDSIQTISVGAVGSAAGSVSQITNSTHLILNAAKQSNTAVVLVGHVTKEGAIAGPKVL